MISLENMSNGELRKVIESNFIEILNNSPEKFDEYFDYAYQINNNMVMNIFYRLVDNDFAQKYPNILFNTFKFILINKKDYYSFRYVPINYYQNNTKEYLDLLKIALNNCMDIYCIKSLLDDVAKKTNDLYFLSVLNLLVDKSKKHIDAHNIFSNINDINNLKEIYEHWDEYCNMYYHHFIYNENNIEIQKDVLCKKLYNISFEKMKDKYYQYIISNRTSKIDQKVIWFEKIITSLSKEEIIQIYNETISVEDELKSTYDDIAKQIDIDSKKSISNISKYQPSQELKIKTINNVNIYDISESNFNLIIHNISAGLTLKHKEIVENLNIDPFTWSNPNIDGSLTISTSEISNRFLGHLTRKKNNQPEIIFAFSNIPEDEIFFSGVYDIGLNTRVKNYSDLSPADGIGQHFLAEQLMTNCFHDYNEIAINRFTDKTKEVKRIPNYIVCFDEINELNLKYAETFNIPILYIDTKKCAYKNAFVIKNKLENTYTSNDLLNNVNEFFSFLCGLKYSEVIFEIVNITNWEETIIETIKNVAYCLKNEDDIKNLLVIVDFIEKNIPKFLQGIESKFNNGDADYSEIINKFSDFSQKMSSTKEIICDEFATDNIENGLKR